MELCEWPGERRGGGGCRGKGDTMMLHVVRLRKGLLLFSRGLRFDGFFFLSTDFYSTSNTWRYRVCISNGYLCVIILEVVCFHINKRIRGGIL